MHYIGTGQMSSEQELISDVSGWILNWVSVPNEKLGHVPCPFARNALITDKIEWQLCDDREHLHNSLYCIMENGLPREIVILGCNRTNISAKDLIELTDDANRRWLLPSGLIALEDHPDDLEIIAGEVMNQGKWALIVVQEISKLKHASEILKRQGYYDRWTQEQVNAMVSVRYQNLDR